MRINCPICGSRDSAEYTYLGDATLDRAHADDADVGAWTGHVYGRSNPRGMHEEHWHHSGGCRAILKVSRNVTSHKIKQVALEGPWKGFEQ